MTETSTLETAYSPEALPAPPPIPRPEGAPWTTLSRFALRAAVLYVVFYLMILLRSYGPVPEVIRTGSRTATDYFYKVAQMPKWFGALLASPCGGGERNTAIPWCWAYEVVWMAAVCLVLAAVWTLIDRRWRYDRTLHAAMRTVIRYAVAFICWNYALGKFEGVQFWYRSPVLLVTPLGAWDGMDIMWTSMGVSVLFGMFTGVGEAVAAFLLVWRRTAKLGAIVAATVMGVIALLDLIHHAGPVGGNAFSTMVVSLFLLVPDVGRMRDVYFLNRPAPRVPAERRLIPGRGGLWLKLAAVVYVAFMVSDRKPSENRGFWFPRHPLSGLFEVESHQRNGVELPLFGDSTRWEYVDLTGQNGTLRGSTSVPNAMLTVRDGGFAGERYSIRIDTSAQRMRLSIRREKKSDLAGRLHYESLDGQRLALRGTIGRDSVYVMLRKLQLEQSVLYGGPGYDRSAGLKP
jgi:hypothetical protein